MRQILIPALLLGLAACSTTRPGTEVKRFHLGQPIARSTITLVPAPGQPKGLEFQSYADAVGRELVAQSFVPVVGDPSAAYVGTIEIRQMARPAPRRGGLSIGLGGGSFGRSGGVGGGVSLPVGQSRPGDIVTTNLSLQIKRRADSSVIWEGSASGEGDSRNGGGDLSAQIPELARALLSGFPGTPGQTVLVKPLRR
jgi:hypothetical protein